MSGIRLSHDTLKHPSIALVPLIDRPLYPKPDDLCPTCQTVHPVKTVHLWLDGKGECLVSAGVYEDLQRVGLPFLTVVGEVAKPPPLKFGPGVKRHQVDSQNRRIQMWTPKPFKEAFNG